MATIVIVGASKGIGLAAAQALALQGHTVIGTSRTPDTSTFPMIALDVNQQHSVESFMTTLTTITTRIDVLIYSAGYDLYSAAEDTTLEELQQQMDTNFTGAVRLIQAMLPIMRQQKTGKLIFLSSIGGLSALPFNSAYTASKFALEGYCESLRYELLPLNIFVSLIEPGQVRTDTLDTSIQGHTRTSVYGVTSGVLAERARVAGRKASLQPAAVVKAIANVVATNKPRLRYLVGMQARSIVLMRQFLPMSLFERFILRLFVQPVLKSGG